MAGFGNGGEFDGFGMSPWSFDRYAEIWDIGVIFWVPFSYCEG